MPFLQNKYFGGNHENNRAGWNRNDIFLASKVGFPSPVDGIEFGLSAKQIERACDASLKRMGIDHIDLYYAHADDRNRSMEERLEAFDKLVQKGYVQRIQSENDRRVRNLHLTAQGAHLAHEHDSMHRRYAEYFRQVLAEDELHQLETLLNKVVKQLR